MKTNVPGLFLLSFLIAGCATPVEQTSSKRLRCYKFTALNSTTKDVTDVHIPTQGGQTEIPPAGPEGWRGRQGEEGIVFETPVRLDFPPTGTQPRPPEPVPIPPGRRLGPFVFYLDGPTESEGMFFTHPDGTRSPGTVEQNGEPIPAGPDGKIHVRKSGSLYCFEIMVKAPPDRPVYVVEFEAEDGKEFVYGSAGPGWQVNVSKGKASGFSLGDRQPIPPGGSRTFTLYSESRRLNLSYKFFDQAQRSLPGGEGELEIRHP